MSEVRMKTVIGASAGEVWRTVSDFNGIRKYLATFTACTTEGSGIGAVRTLTLPDGAKIVERLESLDEPETTLSYSIISSPLPIEHYLSLMKVSPLGTGRCELEWSSTFDVKGAVEGEVNKMIEDIYAMGLEAVKKLHEP